MATLDIRGAFVQIHLGDKKVVIKFDRRTAELLAMRDPKLSYPHILVEKNRTVLYAELQKGLYGILQSSLNFWKQVTNDATKIVYVINTHDGRDTNKLVSESKTQSRST